MPELCQEPLVEVLESLHVTVCAVALYSMMLCCSSAGLHESHDSFSKLRLQLECSQNNERTNETFRQFSM